MKLFQVNIFLHIRFVLVDVLANIISIFKFACLYNVSMPLMLNNGQQKR
jgi:hypothetical protein